MEAGVSSAQAVRGGDAVMALVAQLRIELRGPQWCAVIGDSLAAPSLRTIEKILRVAVGHARGCAETWRRRRRVDETEETARESAVDTLKALRGRLRGVAEDDDDPPAAEYTREVLAMVEETLINMI